jgi:hypothetical protein
MKSALFLLYPLVALAAVPLGKPSFLFDPCELSNNLIGRRQTDVLEAKPKVKNIFKKIDGPSTSIQTGAKKTTIWYGPYKIRAKNVGAIIFYSKKIED